jgi:hypothetical protein
LVIVVNDEYIINTYKVYYDGDVLKCHINHFVPDIAANIGEVGAPTVILVQPARETHQRNKSKNRSVEFSVVT